MSFGGLREHGGVHAAALLFFLVLTVALTWPLVLHLDSAVPDKGDPLLNAWIIDWVCHALTHSPLDLYNAPMYYPAKYPLAYSENMVGIALFVLPLHLAGSPALVNYNVALILGFAFSGFGAWLLARYVTGSTPGALVAGIFYAFTSFKVAHVQHIQVVWGVWLPMLLLALIVFWRRPSRKGAAFVGVAFLMSGLTNIYWLLFGGFTFVLTIGLLATINPRKDRDFWIRLITAVLIACAVLLPLLLPYQVVASEYGAQRTSQEARRGSADWTAWATATGRNLLYGRAAAPELHRDEFELFPGLLVLFLSIYAVFSRPAMPRPPEPVEQVRHARILNASIIFFAAVTYFTAVSGRIAVGKFSFAGADVPAMITVVLIMVRYAPQMRNALRTSRFSPEEWTAALWVIVGLVGSFGWNLFLHPFLFRVIGPFRATRAPIRWAVIVLVGLAVWAAIGVRDLLSRREVPKRRLVAGGLILVAIVEIAAVIRWHHVESRPAPVYRWLARARPGVVLELPMVADGIPYLYLLGSTTHRVPLMNGTSGWEPPVAEVLRKKELALQYDQEFLDVMRRNGGATLIVHEALLTAEQHAALLPLLDQVRFVGRFGTDAIYDARATGSR